MSALDDVLKKHRRRVIEREEATFRQLLREYEAIQTELERQIRALEKKAAEAKAAGRDISPSWLFRERRLETLLDQVKNEIIRFGGKAAPIVAREQREAIEVAYSQTRDVLESISPGRAFDLGSMLNTRGVENAVGIMGDGSPILKYFEENLAPAVAARLKKEVIEGVTLGTPFSTIADRLMQAGDITRQRALAMARTEVTRVRNATKLQIYRENADVLTGWEWAAAKSVRTCPVCLALDGRIFKLDQPFPQHVNCRCTVIPVVDGVERRARTLGADWFSGLDETDQNTILGENAADAYRRGEIELKDLIGWKTSKEFGKRVYTRPLSSVMNTGTNEK